MYCQYDFRTVTEKPWKDCTYCIYIGIRCVASTGVRLSLVNHKATVHQKWRIASSDVRNFTSNQKMGLIASTDVRTVTSRLWRGCIVQYWIVYNPYVFWSPISADFFRRQPWKKYGRPPCADHLKIQGKDLGGGRCKEVGDLVRGAREVPDTQPWSEIWARLLGPTPPNTPLATPLSFLHTDKTEACFINCGVFLHT